MTALLELSVDPELASQYRLNGWWRDRTFLDDLAGWARTRPDEPAVINGRSVDATVRVLTWRELNEHVLRFAAGLRDLGVRPGDVVALQLPDWWETAALLLACLKVGAIAQPMVPELRAREIERAMTRTGATVCVTVEHWAGYEYGHALADVATRLPRLRHRVVYGDSARSGALDFAELFLHERATPDPASFPRLDPDRACLVLFTSGSTGEAKGVLHSLNTIHAGTAGFTARTTQLSPDVDRAAATLRISHIAGPLWAIFGTLLSGGAGIFLDAFDADRMLDVMDQAGATRLLTTPPRLLALLDAQRARPRRLTELRTIAAGATTIPPELVAEVREAFELPLRAVWGMTEIVVGSVVGADDPADWSAHSDGSPLPGLEFRVVTPDGVVSLDSTGGTDVAGGTGSLQVRGAAMCLGTITDHLAEISAATDEDGWFDTGDLARPDGRGGIRIMGRVGDRIYDRSGAVMIPVRDVEDELRLHPNIADVAVIACRDGMLEDVCAVVVPIGEPPTIEELHEFLGWRGMTEWYHPSRLELADSLPRDHLGKIRKHELRAQYDGAAARQ